VDITLSQKFMACELRIFESKLEKSYSLIKKELFSKINKNSKVLEIGPGTGVNFKYYPKKLKLIVIEPNKLLHARLHKNALSSGIQLKILSESSEHLPFSNAKFNFVISTLVLCSVHNLHHTLNEIKRVLKDRGKFLFIEHVLDEHNSLRRITQNIASNRLWRFFGDNCHPNRRLKKAIQSAEFKKLQVKEYLQEGLGLLGRIIKSHIVGSATK